MNPIENIKPFPEEKYKLIKVLEGGRNHVSVRNHMGKSKCYVIKEISEKSIYITRWHIQNEIEIGKKLNHENFAKTFKSYISKTNEVISHYLIMEYIENGLTITDFIEKHNVTKITKEDFKKIVIQLFSGIIYALNQNICPRDLNGRNILIDLNYKLTFIDYGKYVKGYIKYKQANGLEYELGYHLRNLIRITSQCESLNSWEKRSWDNQNVTYKLLTERYTEVLDDPVLKQTKDI